MLVAERVGRQEGSIMSRRIKVISVAALLAVAASVFIVTRASGSAPPPYLSYAAKFACGEYGKLIPGSAADNPEGPVKPGNYQTAINVHNPLAGAAISFVKKAVLVYSGNQPVNQTTFEQVKQPAPQHTATLPADAAMLIDCQDIRKVLLTGTPTPAAPTFIEGWVIIQAPNLASAPNNPLDVTALYTSHGYNCTVPTGGTACTSSSVTREGFSENVETIPAKPITR
jgi:hypothetical protein